MMQTILARIKNALINLRSKGAFDIICGSFLTKLAAFLGSIILVRIISKAEYGTLSYMENLYTYAYLFAGYGLNNAVFRYLVLQKDPESKKGIFDYVLAHGTCFNIVFVAILAVIAHFYPHQADFSIASVMLPIMLLALPLQYLVDSCSFSLRALFRNRQYAIAAVATIVLLWTLKVLGVKLFDLAGAVCASPLSYLIVSSCLLLYFRNKIFAGTHSKRPGASTAKEMRGYSLQYMITNGLWAMFLQNDLLLISMFTGSATAVADYRVAYTIPAAVAILSSSIGIFVAPYFVENEGDRKWVWFTFKKVLLVSIALIGAAVVLIIIFGEPVILLFYGEQYSNILPLMNILLVTAFISNALRYTAANLLAAMGRIRINMIVSGCGMAAQVALDCLLIPQLAEYGAAYSSVIVYSVMTVVLLVTFVKAYRTKEN